jgi:serine/threonine protein kinase
VVLLQDAVDRGWLREGPAGPVSALKLLATAAEIAAGMLQLHSRGIIHGDLSAFNVLLSSADPAAAVGQRGFVAKIGDFGERCCVAFADRGQDSRLACVVCRSVVCTAVHVCKR